MIVQVPRPRFYYTPMIHDGTIRENTTTQNHHNTKGPCQKHTTNNKLHLNRLTNYVIFPEAHE